MTNLPKLNDLQLILLAAALQRDDGNLLPLPDSIANEMERVQKTVPALIRRKLIDEVPVTDRTRIWREEDDRRIGLVITPAGRELIAPGTLDGESSILEQPSSTAPAYTPAPRSGSKTELVLSLLRRPEGATLAEMVDATNWLAHTTRAALTGLRKKGHVIEKTKRDDVTCYRLGRAG